MKFETYVKLITIVAGIVMFIAGIVLMMMGIDQSNTQYTVCAATWFLLGGWLIFKEV